MAEENDGGQLTRECDYCGKAAAALFCRADSARLCVACDRHVHAANALSQKHVRCPICDGCGSQPAVSRFAVNGLALCADCDLGYSRSGGDGGGDAARHHNHQGIPIEGFSRCPTACELAAALGFDVAANDASPPSASLTPAPVQLVSNWSPLDPILGMDPAFRELYVPCAPDPGKAKRQKTARNKQPLLQQLMELAEAELADPAIGNLHRSSPCRPGGVEEEFWGTQTMAFTSLLTLATNEMKGGGRLVSEGNLLWNCIPTNHPTQIWDFNLGKLRDKEESSELDIAFGTNNGGFVITSYNDLIKENSYANTKVLEDIGDATCSSSMNDTFPSNAHHSQQRSPLPSLQLSRVASNTKQKQDSRTVPFVTPPLDAASGGSKHISFGVSMAGNEEDNVPKKVDSEVIAKNRGNAMIRYREKRKTRRYDKRIRYETRKVRADTRLRFKGRFVKSTEALYGS